MRPERTFPRRQLKAGKTSGLSILLNPDLHEYFCTSSDSQGFRVKWIFFLHFGMNFAFSTLL